MEVMLIKFIYIITRDYKVLTKKYSYKVIYTYDVGIGKILIKYGRDYRIHIPLRGMNISENRFTVLYDKTMFFLYLALFVSIYISIFLFYVSDTDS